MIAADGRVVWLRDLVTVVMEGDRVTRVRGLMVDLTTASRLKRRCASAGGSRTRQPVTTMGELTASLAHEVNNRLPPPHQRNTSLRWLAANPPNLERHARCHENRERRKACGGIISRIRLLFKKGTPERELVDITKSFER